MNIRRLILLAIGVIPVVLAPAQGFGERVTQIIDATGDGANALDAPHGIAVDGAGNVCVTGFLSDNAF